MEYCHTPVLLSDCLELLGPRSDSELMVDATLGEGGHSYAFLERFPTLRIIGVDADAAIQAVAKKRLERYADRVLFYLGWSHDFFADFDTTIKRPDSILIDLGISSYHYERGGRGFSFRSNEALDMRIDPSKELTAATLVASLAEADLAALIYENAEERYSRRIAHALVEARKTAKIETAAALASIVERAVPGSYRHGPHHPATKTFQALRIAVNSELSRLPDLLEAAFRVLEIGGRIGIISFHSLEDRIVKNFLRDKNKDCICPPEEPICKCRGKRVIKLLTKKPVMPSRQECESNPPSRSAKLRVAEKILDEDEG